MFAAVISRDDGCPWGDLSMTSQLWLNVEARTVRISDLTATQPGVLFAALTEPAPVPYGGDHLPHVIAWNGRLYLEDGHHRAMRAALRGDTTLQARVLTLPANAHAAPE